MSEPIAIDKYGGPEDLEALEHFRFGVVRMADGQPERSVGTAWLVRSSSQF